MSTSISIYWAQLWRVGHQTGRCEFGINFPSTKLSIGAGVGRPWS